LLLPFYVLKIRKRLRRTKSPAKRQQLAEELKAINGELAAAFKRSEAEGSITDADRQKLFDMTEQLYDHLYLGYTEFKETRMVLDLTRLEKIDALYSELRAAREEKQEARRQLDLKIDAIYDELAAAREEKQEALREKQEMARRIRELEEQLSRKG
jgi:predicted  nucleic acid-binding Zn-ribbon protein